MNEALWPPDLQQAVQVGVGLDLQVDDADLVAGQAGGGGDQLEPERLQTQEDARVHQTAGVDGEQLHGEFASLPDRECGPFGLCRGLTAPRPVQPRNGLGCSGAPVAILLCN